MTVVERIAVVTRWRLHSTRITGPQDGSQDSGRFGRPMTAVGD
jgi:hypothetical protein